MSRQILCNREQYLESFTDDTWNRVTAPIALILRSKWSKRAKFSYIARAVYPVYILHSHPIIHKTQRNKLILLLLKRLYISFPFYQETFLMRRRTVEIKELYPLVATRDNVRCICTQNWKTFYQIIFFLLLFFIWICGVSYKFSLNLFRYRWCFFFLLLYLQFYLNCVIAF